MVTRRTFIITGVAGSAALIAAYWMQARLMPGSVEGETRQKADAAAVLGALVPAMLAGALPDDMEARRVAVDAAVERVQQTIQGLPPASQHELGQLFALLVFPPTRVAFAGLGKAWTEADKVEIEDVLLNWRQSSLDLKRSAYDALHQLILGAWYAGTDSWQRIGYPGPPQL